MAGVLNQTRFQDVQAPFAALQQIVLPNGPTSGRAGRKTADSPCGRRDLSVLEPSRFVPPGAERKAARSMAGGRVKGPASGVPAFERSGSSLSRGSKGSAQDAD